MPQFDDVIDRLSKHYDRPTSVGFRQVLNDLRPLVEAG
jgi:hypothetical protein